MVQGLTNHEVISRGLFSIFRNPKIRCRREGLGFFDLGEVLVSKTDDGHLRSVADSLSFVKSLRDRVLN